MSPGIVGRRVLYDSLLTLLYTAVVDVHLYTNNYTPTVDSALAAFTEAAYDTYPPGGITPSLPTFGSVGNEEAWSTIGVTFPAPTVSGPISVYGFWVRYKSQEPPNPYAMLIGYRFAGAPIVLTNGGPPLPLIIDLSCLDLNNP